ncbi:MAG: hypothetical protein ACI82Z_001624 [Cellvibrionaceae bacterium]|jgi:hypothetical protein
MTTLKLMFAMKVFRIRPIQLSFSKRSQSNRIFDLVNLELLIQTVTPQAHLYIYILILKSQRKKR